MRYGKVNISAGFFFFIAIAIYADNEGLLLQLMAAALIHELGHLVAIHFGGGSIEVINLTPFGAEIKITDTHSLSYFKELIIFLTGPSLNIAVAFLFSYIADLTGWYGASVFAGINLMLGLFNLCPVRILDGGNILATLSQMIFGREVVMVRVISYITVTAMFLLGIYVMLNTGFNFSIIFMAIWLFVKNLSGRRDTIRA